MGRYENFEQISRDALIYALRQSGKPVSDESVERLLAAYLRLPPHRDTEDALAAMDTWQKLILSNGTESMLRAVVEHAKLTEYFDHILSADKVHIYKPHANVYELAVAKAQVPKQEILFVSSNGWDVTGAKAFGFTVAWVNRTGKPMDELGEQPDFEVASLRELVHRLDSWDV